MDGSAAASNGLDVIQGMIDISADRLEGLRTQCATSATLTQQEIRSLETKLVRMFSELLITKSRLPERIPASGLAASGSELKQWLRVVGLSSESVNVCLQRINSLEDILQRSDDELRETLTYNPNYREEEIRRLTNAMDCLRRCRTALSDNAKEPENLFWDSWDRHHHHHHHHHHYHRGSTGNIGVTASPRTYRTMNKQKAVQSPVNNNYDAQSPPSTTKTPDESVSTHGSILTLTPSPSPPNSPCLATICGNAMATVPAGGSGGSGGGGNGTPVRGAHRKSTPPPKKKHQTLLSYHHPSTPSHNGMSSANSMTASTSSSSSQDPLAIPIAKSKSHESQFQEGAASGCTNGGSSSGTNSNSANNSTSMPQTIPRTRLHTDPSPESHSSSMSSDIFMENTHNLTVPRSPCTPIVSLGMGHMISHRFTKVFKMMSTCELCQKQMFFGLKCKECKYRCHKDCEPNVPPSCGLPREFVDEFKKTLKSNDGFLPPSNISPNLSIIGRSGNNMGGYMPGRRQKVAMGAAGHHHPDSSSPGSSCNSSSPSSPALFNLQQQQLHVSGTNSGGGSSTASASTSTGPNPISTPSSLHKNVSQFNFPDVTITTSSQYNQQTTQTLYLSSSGGGTAAATNNNPEQLDNQSSQTSTANSNVPSSMTSSIISNTLFSESRTHSETSSIRTTSGTGSVLSQMNPPLSELADTHKSNDSDKTVSLSGSTSASTDSDRTPVRLDSTEEGDSGNWPRQNSLSLKEWDIPYDDLRLLEKIGKGRFGTVHRALWHGDVAVKLLKEDYLDDEHMLEAFKLEVANFKKTRHENLVLFMGACMNPPYLAIVTSLCKGNTLYTYIHLRRDKFTINRTTLVAQQISQGMGYLHARGIFHKDLRTKNIFLENGKVIITDFGLFSSTKLLYCDIGLGVPSGWLCYLAPELMRALTPYKPTEEILPFSKASDVYSFGTVWYELLCGDFPFKMQPAESIIWQVGRGMKQTLANLQTSRDVKDILMQSWSFQADDRPGFPKLLTLLERLPKKRLARSPSHPVQLSRSAESVF